MNDEISNKNPHNEYSKSISGDTNNSSSNEGKLDSSMNVQLKDSLVQDANMIGKVQSNDPTSVTPRGNASITSEYKVFDGSRKDNYGSSAVKKVDYKQG